ncbi:MAG TPA: NIPSNAP family protein [Ohtaekwangia sp.]|uniref:NIPSNAP family protein n=1 Tax=Ohtaekwangia sp. TaxID=2066019 RepID=UPI002F9307AC
MKLLQAVLLVIITLSAGYAAPSKREFYEIKIYEIANADQEKLIDDYLKNAYLPALHRAGISKVGVFKPVESDTAYYGKRVYVLTPFTSLEQFSSLYETLSKDKQYIAAGKNYIDAPHTNAPYIRLQSIVLKAFSYMPQLEAPVLNGAKNERVYELRSYESHTEKIHKNKVHMFNEGGEVTLFKRLAFHAVFYGEVLAGSRMPNLMYMTSFDNQASRDEHWKTFANDPEWKKLSSMPEYQNNVSKINIYLLHPAEYSDI